MDVTITDLATCCQEILEWRRTGTLVDGKVRKLASGLNAPSLYQLDIAEKMVADAAMKYVILNTQPNTNELPVSKK